MPNRLGLGLRPPMPSYGQGPSISALAQQQHMLHHQQFIPPQPRSTTLFIGSISGGITDAFLNQLLMACGPISSFKRLITPANKPQGFGFAEFQDPDGALRAMALLNGVELPALEDGCMNKKLLVKADEKTRMFLDAYQAQKMTTNADEERLCHAKAKVDELLADINKQSQEAASQGLIDKEKYIIPPHLHDLQEADLPETQRGLVMTEIAQFRERAAKREREKMRDVREAVPNVLGAPSGPKQREWGKPQLTGQESPSPLGASKATQGYGKGAQGYNKPVGFVKAESEMGSPGPESRGSSRIGKTDEELETERREARRKDEENSFRDRERRYEPRERARIQALERAILRDRATKEAEERDRVEMRSRLAIWDDDESDELFYTDRPRWRSLRARRLTAEQEADDESRVYEEKEAENLRRESEAFLARQMDEMQALQEEQRKAGMLLDDGAPVKLNVSLTVATVPKIEAPTEKKAIEFGQEEEEEEGIRKRKVSFPKLDLAEGGEKAKERLKMIRESVPRDKETLFKSKVRWDGLTDTMIDRKLEPLVKRQMTKYLGELEDDDVVMFVLEHLKDHKGPQKLVEGLEPVLEEEAVEFTVSIWRQIIFESMAYGEGLHTERMLVD
ncbi:uncharacterized protein LAESUDRAFT_641758 [Laetiporus sulphureus 93-53]|uniref:PWI domain-containing protein n=1 Tax=Laetiporus sulphureus 93-53 TaxID=1314785 RepID=A0A165HU76_9APHY|nr:uncharacterized protein LAESUDRAFT_641758 [Laetiporus sulphureus 93-53]KZT12192.1 hypothetical protein LAESUDRAFT_641758 [Laetiporus sulphureus 93-53]